MYRFKDIGNIEVTLLKKQLQDNACDWDNEYTQLRSSTFKGQHRDVAVIPLQWSMDNLRQPSTVPAPLTRFYDKYNDVQFFNKLENILRNFYGEGYFIRIMFLQLSAGSNISPHCDSGESLIVNKRVHIPIKTSNKVFFTVGGDRRVITEGEIVEINNQMIHQVENLSDEDRVHLVVDWHLIQGYK
jgi:hypothetical protein